MKALLLPFACGLLTLAGCGETTETPVKETGTTVDSTSSVELNDSTEAVVDAGTDVSPAETSSASTAIAEMAAANLSPEDQLAKLTAAYQQKNDAFLASYRAARTQEERTAALKLRPQAAEFADEFFALAESHSESEAAVDALVWVSQNDRGEQSAKATSKLLASHASNPKILPIVFMMMYTSSESAEPQLRGLLQSSERTTRGVAAYALGSMLMRKDDASIEAKELLQSVVDDYADVSFDMRGQDFKIAPQAEGALFALNNLQIGMVAPDIEGADLQGVDFKLSDYRGKVVLLDFWGHW